MKTFQTLLFLIAFGSLSGQNLVKNPSFEGRIFCPTGEDAIEDATNWDAANKDSHYGYPEYFNECTAASSGVNVPANDYGFSYGDPFGGLSDAYGGILTYANTGKNKRTHLTGTFINRTPLGLRAGKTYFFSMSIRRAQRSQYATRICIKFTGGGFDEGTNPALTNGIFTACTDTLWTDNAGWDTWYGTFVSPGNFQDFAIGNFIPDAHVDPSDIAFDTTEAMHPILPVAYYYIDNVCIADAPGICKFAKVGRDDPAEGSRFSIYPNPSTGTVNIETDAQGGVDYEIIGIDGVSLLSETLYHKSQIDLPRGVYFFRSGLTSRKIVVL
jgi:hypothetical protein